MIITLLFDSPASANKAIPSIPGFMPAGGDVKAEPAQQKITIECPNLPMGIKAFDGLLGVHIDATNA